MTETLVRVGDIVSGMFRDELAEHEEYMAYLDTYTGARPLGEFETGGEIWPFMDFPLWLRREIASIVLLDERPPKRWLHNGYAAIESRAWYEWHWHRGIDPHNRWPRSSRWQKLRLEVIARDGYVCGLCDGDVDPTDVHIDHIMPASLGGKDELDNLQVAHSFCNIRKGNRV